MTWSLVLAIVVASAVLYLYLRSRRQESHHLDDLHITEDAHDREPQQ